MDNSRLQQELTVLRKAIADTSDFEGTGLKGGLASKEFMGESNVGVSGLKRGLPSKEFMGDSNVGVSGLKGAWHLRSS